MSKLMNHSHRLPARHVAKLRLIDALVDRLLRPSIEKRLIKAVEHGRVERLEKLLDQGQWEINKALTPGAPDSRLYSSRTHGGQTLLHRAAQTGQHACALALLNRGAQVDATTDWGLTPAMMAAERADVSTLAVLELHGADLDRRQPLLSTYFEPDYVGPTVTDLFESCTDQPYQAAKARARSQQLEASLEKGASEGGGRARF